MNIKTLLTALMALGLSASALATNLNMPRADEYAHDGLLTPVRQAGVFPTTVRAIRPTLAASLFIQRFFMRGMDGAVK